MKTGKTAIIVQARLGSTRLPGKILRDLGGQSVLVHVIARLRQVSRADLVVIATTDSKHDDAVAEAAAACGAVVFRGDEQDVLLRYAGAARAVDADVIMRVTSDCPLIDADICDAVLALRAATDSDYAANNMPRLFPHGLDCEAFTRAALERAAAEATDPYDREHVTPWLRRTPGLKRANLTGPGWPANQQRWTLDFPDDLTFFENLFDTLPPDRVLPWQDILSLVGRRADLALTNARHRSATAMALNPFAPIAVFRFRADASIGFGHAMRCNTLQTALTALGWCCYWAVDKATVTFLSSSIPPESLIDLASEEPAAQADEIQAVVDRCALLVVDDYDIPAAFARAAKAFSDRIVYLDDLADREIVADLIVNPTPEFPATKYHGKTSGDAKLLIGPRYALLRQQFAFQRQARLQQLADQSVPAPIRHVLVAFGGVDPLDGTSLALETLSAHDDLTIDVVLGSGAPHLANVMEAVAALGPRARLLVDVADMAGMMASADIVIGAPGMSTWERSCLGLPSLLIGIAENQRANAAIVEAANAGIVAGFLTTQSREDVRQAAADALEQLIDRPGRCRDLGRAAAVLCDGRGSQRIVCALLPAQTIKGDRTLNYRAAEAMDEEMLLDWQSAPATRRFALTPRIPSAQEHKAWYQRKIAAPQDWLVFGEIEHTAVGYVRLDWMGEDNGWPQFLVSIATAPGWYQQGIATALLGAARALAPGAHLYARVLAENAASLALFSKAGYSLAADGYFHSLPPRAKEA